jgi:hypothetical protein
MPHRSKPASSAARFMNAAISEVKKLLIGAIRLSVSLLAFLYRGYAEFPPQSSGDVHLKSIISSKA